MAIARHLRWMMAFLEAHHRSEDEGVLALTRERVPAARAVLDDMAADHEAVAVAIAEVEAAAAACETNGDAARLSAAVDALADTLVPHLRREEDEAMPLVSQAVTAAEWADLEQRLNLDGKSMAQLGREGHWLIDGATPEDRDRVLGLVPPVPRFMLVHGFGWSYRRRVKACWSPRHRVQPRGSTAVVVDAGIEAVWDLVRDPTRVGEWSHECVGCEWLGGASEAVPGARFRGRNRQGLLRWGRVCEVVSLGDHEIVWRTVSSRLYPDSTVWAIRLTAVEGGTRIQQDFEVVKGTILEPVYATVIPAHRNRSEALRRDLERIGAVAGTGAARRDTQETASSSTSSPT
jgi:hypothetical protein